MNDHDDHIVRALVKGHEVRVIAAITTDTSREAARRHRVAGAAAVALGRASTSALLLATLTKGGERVTLQLMGDGPLGGITADANDAGDVRAYLVHPDADVMLGGGKRGSLAAAVGRRGVVHVLRDLGLRETYAGQASILTGEIDEDVESYLRLSEQVASALACETILADAPASGGVLVQCLPDGEADLIREAQHLMRTGALYDAVRAMRGGEDALALARVVLPGGLELERLDVRPVRFRCTCSAERVADTLKMVGVAEMDSMIRDDGGAEVVCNFCGETYALTKPQLEAVRAKMRAHAES